MFRHTDRTPESFRLNCQIHNDSTGSRVIGFRYVTDCLIMDFAICHSIKYLFPYRFNAGMSHDRDSDPFVAIQ